MTIDTSSLIRATASTSLPRAGSATLVANSGATKTAITSTKDSSAGAEGSESNSALASAGKQEGEETTQVQNGKSKTETTTSNNKAVVASISGASLSKDIWKNANAQDPNATATDTKPTTQTGEAVSHTQNPSFNSSNQSVLAMGGKDLETQFANDSKTISEKYGYKPIPDASNGSSGTDAQSQGAAGGGFGGGPGGNGPVINSGNTYINSGNVGNGNVNGGPVFELPPSIPPSQPNIPVPQVEVDLGSTTTETDNGLTR